MNLKLLNLFKDKLCIIKKYLDITIKINKSLKQGKEEDISQYISEREILRTEVEKIDKAIKSDIYKLKERADIRDRLIEIIETIKRDLRLIDSLDSECMKLLRERRDILKDEIMGIHLRRLATNRYRGSHERKIRFLGKRVF